MYNPVAAHATGLVVNGCATRATPPPAPSSASRLSADDLSAPRAYIGPSAAPLLLHGNGGKDWDGQGALGAGASVVLGGPGDSSRGSLNAPPSCASGTLHADASGLHPQPRPPGSSSSSGPLAAVHHMGTGARPALHVYMSDRANVQQQHAARSARASAPSGGDPDGGGVNAVASGGGAGAARQSMPDLQFARGSHPHCPPSSRQSHDCSGRLSALGWPAPNVVIQPTTLLLHVPPPPPPAENGDAFPLQRAPPPAAVANGNGVPCAEGHGARPVAGALPFASLTLVPLPEEPPSSSTHHSASPRGRHADPAHTPMHLVAVAAPTTATCPRAPAPPAAAPRAAAAALGLGVRGDRPPPPEASVNRAIRVASGAPLPGAMGSAGDVLRSAVGGGAAGGADGGGEGAVAGGPPRHEAQLRSVSSSVSLSTPDLVVSQLGEVRAPGGSQCAARRRCGNPWRLYCELRPASHA